MPSRESLEGEIKRWIESAESPRDKALLLILFQINASLTENTVATQQISSDFHGHRTKVEKVLNRFGGGWVVFVILIGVIQVMGAFIINGQLDSLRKEVDRNETQEKRITVIEGQILNHDRELQSVRERILKLENDR